MSWEKMFLGLKQKLFQRGTGWEQWEQALWEGTGPPEHTFSGDRMPAQPTVPFVSQSSGPALCVKRCGLEGGGGEIIVEAIKRLSRRCSGEKWEEAQMKFRFRMLKNDYFIQISWMGISFRALLPPEPQPCSKSTQRFIKKPILHYKRPRVHNYGFLSPLHNKTGRLSSSFYSDFREAFLFYF